tara:strand:+ start:434 stop:1045 length:612 start_codon:yes stop_codon:yes gene_type:complete
MTDFIKVYDNVLPSEECKDIIAQVEAHPALERGMIGNDKVDLKLKATWQIPGLYFSNNHPNDKRIADILFEPLKDYANTYRQLNFMDEWSLDVRYNIQKYDPGDAYFVSHSEFDYHLHPERLLVWTVYLNTVTEGGGTRFDDYDRTIDAVEGRVVIFPAYFTHMHRGIVSKTQSKYIITGWCSYLSREHAQRLRPWDRVSNYT